jgi:predicted Zn-dependent protease
MIEKSLKWLSEKVDEAEIFKLELKGANILTKKTDIDTFKEKRSTGYGIRVIKDKRMGFYFSNTPNTGKGSGGFKACPRRPECISPRKADI